MEAKVKSFLRDERGTETVEWAIMIGIIAVAAIGTIVLIGQWVLTKFQTLEAALP
jgi:Flp pilus assembly pilin Flp